MNRQLRIPIPLGFALVIGLVGGIAFFFETFLQTTNAAPSLEPKNVTVTNVSDTGFSVTWTTDVAATGALVVNGPLGAVMTAFDERDAKGKLGTYGTHSVNVHEAKPNGTFSFSILSNGKKFTNKGRPYSATTGAALDTETTKLEPAYGSVLTPEGNPAVSALVYLTLEGSQTLSALTNDSGNWLIPLNRVRSSDVQAYLTPAGDRITETVIIRLVRDETSATTDTLNDNPVPTMTLGKAYDFRKIQAKAATSPGVQPQKSSLAQTVTDSQQNVLGAQNSPKTFSVSIKQPANGSAITTTLPLFQGTGIPGKRVTVTVGITNPVTTTVDVPQDGVWRYTPAKPLGQGKQSITITTIDQFGKAVALTNIFEILKSGTQVLGEATPSGTLAPTPTPTATVETPTPEPTVTEAPTPSLIAQPPPETGSSVPAVILILLSVVLVTSGTLLFIR